MSSESYVKNCHIQGSPEDLFPQQPNGDILVRLDGYAIIPMKEFERLKLGCVAAFHASKNPSFDSISFKPLGD